MDDLFLEDTFVWQKQRSKPLKQGGFSTITSAFQVVPWSEPRPRPNQSLIYKWTLYTDEEKKNTPPYSIAREKLIAMQMENLLLRGKSLFS
jgi:hypothetical protein